MGQEPAISATSVSERVNNVLYRLAGRDETTALEPVSAERIRPILRAGRTLAVVAAIVLLFAHFTNALLLDNQVSELNANEEGNPPTWASSDAVAAVAVAAFTSAIMTGPRVPLSILGFATAFLSMNDVVSLHERIAVKLLLAVGASDTWDSVLWPALYLPLLAVTAILILRMTRTGTSETFRITVVGLSMLVVAVITEVVSAPWSSGTNWCTPSKVASKRRSSWLGGFSSPPVRSRRCWPKWRVRRPTEDNRRDLEGSRPRS